MNRKNSTSKRSQAERTGEGAAKRAARRRIRYVTPMTAGKVLGHRRYWTLPFLSLYLELCDETVFHEPENGYLLGQHVAELARRIEVGEVDGYASEEEKLSWRVHALAVWGSACRAFGELVQAESAYRRAADLAEDSRVSDDARGELHARRAGLGMVRGKPDPIAEAGRAVDLFTAAGNSERVADALVIRGAARYLAGDPHSLTDFVAALEHLDERRPRGRRTLTTVLHNIALVISGGGVDVEAQEAAYRLLTRVKARLPRSRSIQKSRVVWVEGLLLARLGITRLAERRLLRARRTLDRQGRAFDLAAVSLDLLCLYLEDGELDTAVAMAAETRRRLQELEVDGDLSAVAERLQGHLTVDGVRELRQSLSGDSRLPEGATPAPMPQAP